MADFVDHAILLLKERGFRITQQRRWVLELLERASEALSVHEMQERLDAQGCHVDPVSLYRILTCFEENGLAHRLLATGKFRRCELEPEESCHQEQADHCHHNLICRSCGAIEELHCPGLDEVSSEIAQRTGFRVEAHNLEFQGLCRRCG